MVDQTETLRVQQQALTRGVSTSQVRREKQEKLVEKAREKAKKEAEVLESKAKKIIDKINKGQIKDISSVPEDVRQVINVEQEDLNQIQDNLQKRRQARIYNQAIKEARSNIKKYGWIPTSSGTIRKLEGEFKERYEQVVERQQRLELEERRAAEESTVFIGDKGFTVRPDLQEKFIEERLGKIKERKIPGSFDKVKLEKDIKVPVKQPNFGTIITKPPTLEEVRRQEKLESNIFTATPSKISQRETINVGFGSFSKEVPAEKFESLSKSVFARRPPETFKEQTIGLSSTVLAPFTVFSATAGVTAEKGLEKTGFEGFTIPEREVTTFQPQFGTVTPEAERGVISKQITIPEKKVLTPSQVGSGVEVGGEIGKYFIPGVGGGLFAAEVSKGLAEEDFSPVQFAKERPVETVFLLGGASAFAGGKVASKVSRLKKTRKIRSLIDEAPEIAGGLQKDKSFLITSRRKADDFTLDTVQRFRIEDDLIRGGEGRMVLREADDILLKQDFTFFGKTGKGKVTQLEGLKVLDKGSKVDIDSAILRETPQGSMIAKQVSEADTSFTKILTSDLKATNVAGAGISKTDNEFTKVIFGRTRRGFVQREGQINVRNLLNRDEFIEVPTFSNIRTRFTPEGVGVIKRVPGKVPEQRLKLLDEPLDITKDTKRGKSFAEKLIDEPTNIADDLSGSILASKKVSTVKQERSAEVTAFLQEQALIGKLKSPPVQPPISSAAIKNIFAPSLSLTKKPKLKPQTEKVKELRIEEQSPIMSTLLGTVQATSTGQKQRGQQKVLLDTNQRADVASVQEVSDILSSTQASTTTSASATSQRSSTTTTVTTPTTTTPPPRTPKIRIPFGLEFDKRRVRGVSKKQAYNVFVRSRGQRKKINKNPLNLSTAKDLGAWTADNTLAAQFSFKKTKGSPKESVYKVPSNYFLQSSGKFRNYRIKNKQKIPLKNKFIELSSQRLDTSGEVNKIQAERFLARNRKPRKKKKTKKTKKKSKASFGKIGGSILFG